jgi:hypothetical protein
LKLEEYKENLALEIAFWYVGLGDLSMDLSAKFRALGIMVLLTQGESDLFYHHLIRSASARELYLRRLRDERIADDHHRVSGRYEPLLDAIASGERTLGAKIVELSPTEFQEGREYEDDYCYAQILHRFVQQPPADAELPPLLDRFETYLAGEPNARFEVCRALAARDQEAFDEAFEGLLMEHEERIEKDKERGQLEEPQVAAERQVFVEGLALHRIAEDRGLTTQPEYRFCPSMGRVPMKRPYPGE